MARRPAAVIIDLNDLSDLDADSAVVWVAASQVANAMQPPTRLALCIPPTRQLVGRLRRLGAVRVLSIFVTVEQARSTLVGQTPAPSE